MAVLFWDTGIGLEHARWLYEFEGVDVFLYVDVHRAFPRFEDNCVGYGIVPKVEEFAEVFHKRKEDKITTDFIVFTDVGLGNINDFFRSLGIKTFGADGKSQNLELDRIFMREKLKELGIPVQEYKVIKGIKNLLANLNVEDTYIKVNSIRGNIETFKALSKENFLNVLGQSNLLFLADEIEFILEKAFEGNFIEIGFDSYVSLGRFVKPYFFTFEYKGIGNLYFVVNQSPFDEVMEKLQPFLVENRYTGMLCMEGFFDGERVFPTDITCRFPYPGSSLHPRFFERYYDVLYQIANMRDEIKMEFKGLVGIELGIYNYGNKIIEVKFPSELKKNVGFRNAVKVKDKYYFIPNDPVFGTLNLVIENLDKEDFEKNGEEILKNRAFEILKMSEEIEGIDLIVGNPLNLLEGFYKLLKFGYNPLKHLASKRETYITKFFNFKYNPVVLRKA